MRIHFDPRNLLAEHVGEANGLTPAEVDAHRAAALAAMKEFKKASDAGTYGFPYLPFQKKTLQEIAARAKQVAGTFDTVCVVGIGGSALGAWALDCFLRGPHPVQPAFTRKNPRLVILDNVDPTFVEAALASMKPDKTHVVVIAKSGATAETIATYMIVADWMTRKLGATKAAARTTVVTSAKRGDLKTLATSQGLHTFHLPDNVGGRFSVFSAVGLVPAALAGFDIGKICKGAAAMTSLAWKEDFRQNVALESALWHWLIWTKRNKTIQVAFPYTNKLWGAAFWFRQLWAESLGKEKGGVNVGQTPVAALGATDQHSQVQLYVEGPNDKVFSFWATAKWPVAGTIPKAKPGLEGFDYLAGKSLAKLIDAERVATATALTDYRRPNCTYTLEKLDEEHLGAFLQMLEFQTAFAGHLLGVDAFNQPGVELAKKLTFCLMGRPGYEAYREKFTK